MIPITEHTAAAVAALIYNHAYEQDPDSGWIAGDEHSGPGHAQQWLEWSACLLQTLEEQPEATDEQLLVLAARRVDWRKVGFAWDSIWMQQLEEGGDEYSTMTEETAVVLPLVRDFLERPDNYPESDFIQQDPAYLAYLDAPL